MTRLEKKIQSYYWRLSLHKPFENTSRHGVLKDCDLDPHDCIVQFDRLVSKHVMGARLQFVCLSKRTFSSNSLSLEFSLPLEFFILHATKREADDVQMERKGNWMKSRLANYSPCYQEGNRRCTDGAEWNQSWPIILHATKREADDVQMERNEIKAGQSDAQTQVEWRQIARSSLFRLVVPANTS